MVFIITSFTSCYSTSTVKQIPELKPENFNFIFKYGVGAKNALDTFKGEYIQDMVIESPIATELKLSDEEMKIIYSEMKKISIQSYQEIFKPKGNAVQTPFTTYSIRIVFNDNIKNIYWEDENDSKTKEAIQLRELFKKIREIVSNKEEFKKLPKPKGGYM